MENWIKKIMVDLWKNLDVSDLILCTDNSRKSIRWSAVPIAPQLVFGSMWKWEGQRPQRGRWHMLLVFGPECGFLGSSECVWTQENIWLTRGPLALIEGPWIWLRVPGPDSGPLTPINGNWRQLRVSDSDWQSLTSIESLWPWLGLPDPDWGSLALIGAVDLGFCTQSYQPVRT